MDAGTDGETADALLATPWDAAERSHAPCSPPSAPLRSADGAVYAGCNVESANSSNTLYALGESLPASTGPGTPE